MPRDIKDADDTRSAVTTSHDGSAGRGGLPNVGEVVKRFRTRRGESLRDVAKGTGLSPSFLSMLERGECDITLSRLAAIASHFDHDVGSLLGYSARGARPQIIHERDRVAVDRGAGIDYQVLPLPGTELEIVIVAFEPHTSFKDELTHEGVDIGLVLEGRIVVTINDVDYPLKVGEAAIWSGAYRHLLRNEDDERALLVAVVTERVY
jgi:transcriptional regulator with XRE-family HTH domain